MKNLEPIGWAIQAAVVVLIIGLTFIFSGCGAKMMCPRCKGINTNKLDGSEYYGNEYKCYDCGLWWWHSAHDDIIVRYD